MLGEKVTALHKDFDAMRYSYEAIKIAIPAKEAIDKACEELREILDGGKLADADGEIKTAIASVYSIFERASKGLSDESVAALFRH